MVLAKEQEGRCHSKRAVTLGLRSCYCNGVLQGRSWTQLWGQCRQVGDIVKGRAGSAGGKWPRGNVWVIRHPPRVVEDREPGQTWRGIRCQRCGVQVKLSSENPSQNWTMQGQTWNSESQDLVGKEFEEPQVEFDQGEILCHRADPNATGWHVPVTNFSNPPPTFRSPKLLQLEPTSNNG